MQPDRLVDARAELVADAQVLWREPAAHAVVLKPLMQASSELIVLGRVADEAGVELYGLTHQGWQVLYVLVGQSNPTQEDLRQRPRLSQRAFIDHAWAPP